MQRFGLARQIVVGKAATEDLRHDGDETVGIVNPLRHEPSRRLRGRMEKVVDTGLPGGRLPLGVTLLASQREAVCDR